MRAKDTADGSKCKLVAVAFIVTLVLAAVAGAGCTSKDAVNEGDAPAVDSSQTQDSEYSNFLDNDSGIYPDTYYNTQLLNLGNRGCNSCHTDLFSVMDINEDGFDHILVSTGYGKNGTYKDCEPCHRTHMELTGMYMGDIIHASHYSNETFNSVNGNCWSCHALNGGTNPGDPYELVLFDDIADTAALGGYSAAVNSTSVRDWIRSRGFSTGLVTSISVESAPDVSVTFDQAITDPEDVFLVDNWGYEVTGKGEGPNIYKAPGEDDTFDLSACCDESNAVTISGVKNSMTFTKADLEAMPQTEFTTHISCGTNGAGGCLTANIPFTGVPMDYIIDLCGGLEEDINAVMVQAYDGWISMGIPLTSDIYTHDAYLVTKAYGKDLTESLGAPILLVSTTGAGVTNVKHIQEINFIYADAPFDSPGQLTVNGMWFQNDGATYKAGDSIDLSAATYAFTRQCGDITTVSFSFDMGLNWIDYDMASEIDGYDSQQWVCAYLKWIPQSAGTYCILMQATTDQGVSMTGPVSLRLVVEE